MENSEKPIQFPAGEVMSDEFRQKLEEAGRHGVLHVPSRFPSVESINLDIQLRWIDANQISDGYHTFGELYSHRIALWLLVCKLMWTTTELTGYDFPVWRTKVHSDGSVWGGWFLLGMGTKAGEQITYHLPISDWDRCEFAETLDRAPEWDGHTSADVLERIKNL